MRTKAQPITIAVQDGDGVVRKITKLIPYGDGGFAVHVPYHKAQIGWLLKMPVDYKVMGETVTPISECTEYSATDRVKLSYHPSGFVQFSGEMPGKIISGLDPITGEPKGLGIITNPLSSPIRTGPTFGITAWGLSDFESLAKQSDDALIFPAEEMYFRGCSPGTQNGVCIEGFVFPPRYWAGVRGESSKWKMSICFIGFEASGAVLELKIIRLQASDVFIGVLASHVRVSFKDASGFTLNGPSESKTGSIKNALLAIYPGTMRERLQELAKSLNYQPQEQS